MTSAAAPAPLSPALVARETLRALVAPRRLVPIVVVVTPLLAEQAQSKDARGILIGAALCAAAVILAPVSFRVLAAERPTLARVLIYAAIGAAVVLALGVAIPRAFRMRPTFLTLRWNVLVEVALYWAAGWGLGRDIDLEARLAAQRARAEALAREAERAQLLALRAHLDPHFLFNTLNAIAEWCRLDGAVAEGAILRLASMLRAVLDGVRAETWPLEREAALCDALFDLYRLRDPDRFDARAEIDPALASFPVPPLLLLPLVENAMKHGPAAGHRGPVRLAAARAGRMLVVTIENPGRYAGPRPGSDGLPMVEKRLALAYGSRARFAIEAVGERTRVTVEIPEEGA
jgi:sensor histidine kinase YesM